VTALFAITVAVGFFVAVWKMLYGGWAPYIVMDSLIVLLVVCGVLGFLRDRSAARRLPFASALVVFALFSLVGLVSPAAGLMRGVMGFRSLFLCSGLAFAGYVAFRSEKQIIRIYWWLIVLGVVTGTFGIYQWFAGPEVVATWGGSYKYFATTMYWHRDRNSGETVFRAFSTFAQPGVFGSAMSYLTLIALAGVLSSVTHVAARMAFGLATVVMLSGLVASGSRSALIEVVLGAVLMVGLNGGIARRLGLIAKVSLVVGLALYLGNRLVGSVAITRFGTILLPQSYFWRWFNPLAEGVRMGLLSPFGFGLGYTSGGPFFVSDGWVSDLGNVGQNVDSGIGAVATDLGIGGLVLYVYFMFKVAEACVVAWRALPPGRLKDMMLAPAAFGILGLLVSPISNVMRPSIPPAIIYWFLVGALVKSPLVARASMQARLFSLRRPLRPAFIPAPSTERPGARSSTVAGAATRRMALARQSRPVD
jgi:hypothetical protein